MSRKYIVIDENDNNILVVDVLRPRMVYHATVVYIFEMEVFAECLKCRHNSITIENSDNKDKTIGEVLNLHTDKSLCFFNSEIVKLGKVKHPYEIYKVFYNDVTYGYWL